MRARGQSHLRGFTNTGKHASFESLDPMDKVSVAMWGKTYQELDDEEEQDLVIAHCLGFNPVKRDEPRYIRAAHYPRGTPSYIRNPRPWNH